MIKKVSKLILLTLLVELVFCSYTPLKGIIALMVDFQQEVEDDVLTSGDGTFLDEFDVGYIEHEEINRCSPDDAFIVDPPPHDYQYFSDQLTAVKNYYNNSDYRDNTYEDKNSKGDFSYLNVGNNCYIGDCVYFDLSNKMLSLFL